MVLSRIWSVLTKIHAEFSHINEISMCTECIYEHYYVLQKDVPKRSGSLWTQFSLNFVRNSPGIITQPNIHRSVTNIV